MNIKVLPADKYLSMAMRISKNHTCQASGKTYLHRPGALHACHIVGRANRSVRWHPLNILVLSFGEHRKYDSDAHYHIDFSVEQIGQDNYDWLREQKNKIVKYSKKEVAEVGKFYRKVCETIQPGEPVPVCPIVEEKLNES